MEVWRQTSGSEMLSDRKQMFNDKGIAQCTNSGGMIMCEYLQGPGSTTTRVQDGDAETNGGLSGWTVRSTWSIGKGSWVELQQAMDFECWFTLLKLHKNYMTMPTVVVHMHICPQAVIPEVVLPSTEDYLCCNIASWLHWLSVSWLTVYIMIMFTLIQPVATIMLYET